MTWTTEVLADLANRLRDVLTEDEHRALSHVIVECNDLPQVRAETEERIARYERESVNAAETNNALRARLERYADGLEQAWRHVAIAPTDEAVEPEVMAEQIVTRNLALATAACEAAVKVARLDAGGSLDPFDWFRVGIDNGWVSDAVCDTHDGVPYTEAETAEFDDGYDPCVPACRIWFLSEDDARPESGSDRQGDACEG